MNPAIRAFLRVSALALGALATRECLAQMDPWEFEVYPYATTPRGMAEFETDNAVVASGHNSGGGHGLRDIRQPAYVVQRV